MGWSEKYKKSIDCNNPKGFSQRAHCQGRKKKMSEEKKDHEYSMARSELKTVTNAVKRLQKKMGKKGEGNLQAWVQSKITKAADYIDTAADYVTNEETKSGDQGLRDWFGKSKSSDGKKGWVQLGGKWAGKPCARQPGQTSTPKCGSSKMAANLSAEEEESARRRKNRQDPNQPEKSGAAKPTNVKTEEMNIQEVKDKPGKGSGKKDACYNKVKSRYSVWPSAYASGALVKCRKVGAANWGNKTESVEFSNWRDDFKATEYEFIDIIKPEPLNGEKIDEMIGTTGIRIPDPDAPDTYKKRKDDPEKKKLPRGYVKFYDKHGKGRIVDGKKVYEDFEKEVPSKDLKKLVKKAVKRIDYDVDGDVDPKDKVEKKTGEYGEQLPTPFGKFRTKVKNESFSDWRLELDEKLNLQKAEMGKVVKDFYKSDAPQFEGKSKEKRREMAVAAKLSAMREDWQKVNKYDETDGMSPAAVKAYRRENPGSKLKTAVTGDPKPGSKDAKRRKSFCARSKGQQDMHNIDCSKTPDKPVCKARRRWKC